VAGAGRVIRAVISRVPVPGVGGRSDRGLGTGSALAHQRVLKPGGGCEGEGEREARMPVADWTIQRQAFSGPLRGGGGRSLVLPSSRYPGPMLSGSAVAMPTDPGPLRAGNRARVASAASSAFDLNPRSSRLDDASDIAFAFAAAVLAMEAGKEAHALLLSAGGRTARASAGRAGEIEGADAARWGSFA
jgi:hypothetical protein